MVNKHNYSFFGQQAGMIFKSPNKAENFVFLQCLKKNNEVWEKPSKGEGKVVKFSLEEIAMILEVLYKRKTSWNTYHTYKDNKTPITFKWADNEQEMMWINIGPYSKMLKIPQIIVFRALLTHVFDEKIEFATIPDAAYISDTSKENVTEEKEDGVKAPIVSEKNFAVKEEVKIQPEEIKSEKIIELSTPKYNSQKKERHTVKGAIKGDTEKALLIDFNSGGDIWIPKSTVHNQYRSEKNIDQEFFIDTWILKRNKVIS